MEACVDAVGRNTLFVFSIQVSYNICNQFRCVVHVKNGRQRVKADRVQLVRLPHYNLCEFAKVFFDQRLFQKAYMFLRQSIFQT